MKTTKTDIKEVSTFKLRVEIQTRQAEMESLIKELYTYTLEEIKAELKRRHIKGESVIKIHLTKDITDVMVDGSSHDLAYLMVRLFASNDEFRKMVKESLVLSEALPENLRQSLRT